MNRKKISMREWASIAIVLGFLLTLLVISLFSQYLQKN